MSSIVHAQHIFSVGEIMIYELKPSVYDFTSFTKYFWRRMDQFEVNGPFDSIPAALQASERTKEVLPDNVIRVDFKAKKRIK